MITIKHDIKRYGRALKGHILDCKFSGEGSKRYDGIRYYSKDNNKYIASFREPELRDNILYVWGYHTEADLKEIAYTYGSEQAAQDMLDFINTFMEKEEMKKYTLEQLKKEEIKIKTLTKEIGDTLMKKFEQHNISWCDGKRATDFPFWEKYKEKTLVNLYYGNGRIVCGDNTFDGLIITPDQIDWGEEMKKYTDYLMDAVKLAQQNMDKKIAELSKHKQDKTPAVFIKAQKDWSGFKSFVKEIEAHGRGLTSSQLKTFMAKIRKDMGEDKK